jgi:aromatic ring-opening dioxygenase catalytic subunit (LigB family)
MVWKDVAYDWAVAFDEQVKRLILAGDHESIIHFDRLGVSARLSVPTPEHFLPLLDILALQNPKEAITFFAEKVTLGLIAMRLLLCTGKPLGECRVEHGSHHIPGSNRSACD